MEQQVQLEKTPWVLVSSLKESTKEEDLNRIAPEINKIIDEWQSQGRLIWSGGFDDNKTSMAVFEGTKEEAKILYDKYDKICSDILTYGLYQWDAMPILSVLSKN